MIISQTYRSSGATHVLAMAPDIAPAVNVFSGTKRTRLASVGVAVVESCMLIHLSDDRGSTVLEVIDCTCYQGCYSIRFWAGITVVVQ
eukprot:IDg16561t1